MSSFGIPVRNGLGVGLLASTSLATRNKGFSPASLFTAGEQGYWLDPSDFSTMFQDEAGTTPVTAVGQSVRRILDKSGRGNHFTQANVANAPLLQQDAGGNYFLLFDGSDDWLQSAATINPGAVDKAQVFAGVRKLSDASEQVIVEASATSVTNDGSFTFTAARGSAPNYAFPLRGSTVSTLTATTFTSPVTNVLACQYDLAQASRDTEIVPTINAATPTLTGSGAASAGTGNFLTYTHYIGRRAGTSLPLNGRLYQLITRYGANLTADQIAATETFVNSKTGAY